MSDFVTVFKQSIEEMLENGEFEKIEGFRGLPKSENRLARMDRETLKRIGANFCGIQNVPFIQLVHVLHSAEVLKGVIVWMSGKFPGDENDAEA